MGDISIEPETRTAAEKGAVQHLHEALAKEGTAEKDFHIKQTLQLLDVNVLSADD